ncbi:MAG: histidine utilization repressor [Pseudomonadota bacterium]
MSQPRYETIKNHLLTKIERGELLPGTKVASENQLSQQFSVSRMTARRALDELSDAGILFRSQGLGTFVSDSRPMSSMLEIRNIADEIRERGHKCTVEVLQLESVAADVQQAGWFGLEPGAAISRSVLVYFENGQAIQFEDRFVNSALVPDYLEQDFTATTPNVYLSKIAPLTEADHIVEAILPGDESEHLIAQHMNISSNAPCLKISRRTWSQQGMVSVATLIHPGDRYRLGGHIHINKPS